ncbi:MAG: hypothetical protein A2Y17_09055 [Clostridiales bacterium GWF2_38_85]|nr:MAG: hypothetical protein A2Y17_09055 [Clostridiales bacterium GWF2_38_85]HBL83655.1 hypothetical protein [Clostridiales bacterium]
MSDLSKYHTVRGYQLLEQGRKPLTYSMEDYLEMIYRHTANFGFIRLNRIAELLNVTAPSTVKMLHRLSDLKLLYYKKMGSLNLLMKVVI